MKFTFWLSFLFISIFFGKQESTSVIKIDLSKQAIKDVSLSNLTKDIQYIPLSNDKFLNDIVNVKHTQNGFYVIDSKSLLLRFSKKGEFEAHIGKFGKGPGEYLFITDFFVHESSNIVYALISYEKKINKYNSSGAFIQSFDLPMRTQKIAGFKDRFLTFNNISNGSNPISFNLMDLNGKLLNQFANKYKFNNSKGRVVRFEGECLFYNFQNNLHFKEIYSDTVFYLKDKNITPKYIIQSRKNGFTIEARQILNAGNDIKDVIIQSNLLESKNYLFFEYNNETLVYAKNDSVCFKIGKKEGFVNDFDGGPNVVIKSIINDNTLLTWLNAFELKAYISSDAFKSSTPKYPEKKKALEKLANSLNENDNPVLMLIKLKE